MKRMTWKRFALATAIVLCAGCAGQTPNLDQNWGKSQEAVSYSQRLNPEAPVDPTRPVEGMTGEQTAIVGEKYDESFGIPQQRPIYYINMPGVTSK